MEVKCRGPPRDCSEQPLGLNYFTGDKAVQHKHLPHNEVTIGRIDMFVTWRKEQIRDEVWPIENRWEARAYLEKIKEVEDEARSLMMQEVAKFRRVMAEAEELTR